MTRSRRSSRYLGTITQADLDQAAAQTGPLELSEAEADFHDDITAPRTPTPRTDTSCAS